MFTSYRVCHDDVQGTFISQTDDSFNMGQFLTDEVGDRIPLLLDPVGFTSPSLACPLTAAEMEILLGRGGFCS